MFIKNENYLQAKEEQTDKQRDTLNSLNNEGKYVGKKIL